MKLAQTQNGKIIVTRRTKNGAYERMGELTTTLSLKEAKAKYHEQLEQFENFAGYICEKVPKCQLYSVWHFGTFSQI